MRVMHNLQSQGGKTMVHSGYQQQARRKVRTPAHRSRAPFRKVAIDVHRNPGFDPDRDLGFGKTGIVFRDKSVTFRDRGIKFRSGSISLLSSNKKDDKWKDKKTWKGYKTPMMQKKYSPPKRDSGKQTAGPRHSHKVKVPKQRAPARKTTHKVRWMKPKTPVQQRPPQKPRSYDRVEYKGDFLPMNPYEVPMTESYKKNAVNLNNIGVKHYNKGNYPTAVMFFTESLRHDPQLQAARRNYELCSQLVNK